MFFDGRPIQILRSVDGAYEAEIAALEGLLTCPRVANCQVMVVSVAGLFRMGKSFLLNLILKYLYHLQRDESWVEDKNSNLEGFTWRGGMNPETSGIYAWSEPILLDDENGKKVAVILLDTEGTFDANSTLKQNATIFALSTLLSSVQIYNMADNILEDSLQYLQYFTEYGRLVLKRSKVKPFEKLLFLVRDWSWPTKYSYGADGGAKLLKTRLQPPPETLHDDQLNSAQRLRRHIHSCFESIECVLLPHPGMTVATSQEFKGSFIDIEVSFVTEVEEMLSSLFHPSKLTIKTMKKTPVTGIMLFELFKNYLEIFKSGTLPEPLLAYEMTARAKNRFAVEHAKDIYRVGMEKDCGEQTPYVQKNSFEEMHSFHKEEALKQFNVGDETMGSNDQIEMARAMLLDDIEKLRGAFLINNESKSHLSYRTALLLIIVTYIVYTLGGFFAWITLEQVSRIFYVTMAIFLFVLGIWIYAFFTNDVAGYGRFIDRLLDQPINYIVAQLGISSTVERQFEVAAAATLSSGKKNR